jgi:hypothetical protein
MKKHGNLSLVEDISVGTKRVRNAVGHLKPLDLTKQIVHIYNQVSPAAYPFYLRIPLRIMSLSQSIGMGYEIDSVARQPVVHLDETFLDDVLVRQPRSLHPTTARYFVLSAAAHNFVKDTPYIRSHYHKEDNTAMIKAWQWAGSLALREMQIKPEIQDTMLTSTKEAARELEEAYAHDMLFCINQARLYDVNPPKLRSVPAWVGIAFPKGPGEA